MRFKFLFLAVVFSRYPCAPLGEKEVQKVKIIWQQLLQKYGYPEQKVRPPKVCVDNKAFREIPRGAHLRSAYDRKNHLIFLRKWEVDALEHELAHAYLNLRYPNLPYAVSENLSRCLYEPYVLQKNPPANLKRFLKSPPTSYCISRRAAFYLLTLSEKEVLQFLK